MEVLESQTLVLVDRRAAADGVAHMTLAAADGGRLPDWTAGAHIDVILDGGVTRQYSLCGDTHRANQYEIAVQRADGTGSRFIHDRLQVGDMIGLGGPRNTFPLVPASSYRFIAGGIGITPIRSMIKKTEELGADWRLLYLGRSRERMAFLDELAQFGSQVDVQISAESGRADIAGWAQQADPDTKFFACGPAGMLSAVDELARERRKGWVRTERFAADITAPLREASFDIELVRTGRVVTVEPGRSVATVIREAGVALLTSCERGVCGTCETTVLAGVPDHRDALLDADDRESGTCMFPCVSRSVTDRLVLDL